MEVKIKIMRRNIEFQMPRYSLAIQNIPTIVDVAELQTLTDDLRLEILTKAHNLLLEVLTKNQTHKTHKHYKLLDFLHQLIQKRDVANSKLTFHIPQVFSFGNRSHQLH